ncbi:hypothetical protein [Clostridium sp. 'White wine YQ']|uniref:hypothetical protein n=1 Tax=Clostridium sp. 'White wine YQ' TaxID=3027474 RepID=UPI00236702CC|nr:hypothetical protein [Clostridium sp. 'White wine YQ']MDD7793090.1 hypothetical protein [Clostridium sp. 'White wine YQ']
MKKIIVIIVLSLLISIGGISYGYIKSNALEKFTVSQDGKVLTDGNGQEYILDKDFCTSLEAISFQKEFGRTNSDGKIYEIDGQADHNWIVFSASDEMSIPNLYHKKEINSFSLSQEGINEIRLISNKGVKQSLGVPISTTSDSNIIKEFSSSISESGSPQEIKLDRIMSLQILSKEYAGIAYRINIIITNDNNVFLSKDNGNNFILAGNFLSNWILSNIKQSN